MPNEPPPDPKAEEAKAKNMHAIADLLKRAGDTAHKVAKDATTIQKEMTDLDKEDK